MDLSGSLKEHLPKSRSTTGGLVKSLALLCLALAIAIAVGAAGLAVLRLLVPDVPVYTALVFGLVALILSLRAILRRFAWIVPWYYLLPALLFLLAFTFFPVVLTVILAFTDYAGIRNGQLNVGSETPIVAVDGARLTVANATTLDCADLRNGCVDVQARIYSSATLTVPAEGLAGVELTLAEAPPAGRDVLAVEMLLPDLGFSFEAHVVSVNGSTLTLVKEPPFPPELDTVTLRLDRAAVDRIIQAEDGAKLVLNAPLPAGFEPEAIARFNAFGWVGTRNFATIFGKATRALFPVFAWNVSFAVLTIVLNTAAGVFLAVLLNNPSLRFRNVYRTLLIVPWALPSIITIQVWKGFLNQNFGAINRLLMLLDVTPAPINWLGDPMAAKAAVLLVNLWLGLPFMMTATLGALSAIPQEIYEASRIDGANPWQSFWGVTGPLLRTALVPITLTGFAFNFNNFNLIFLLTDGGPATQWGTATARGTDILISWAYNEAFRSQGGYAYGLGSAISILIFVITLAVSLVNFRVTGALDEKAVG